jgi:hypothetical protein
MTKFKNDIAASASITSFAINLLLSKAIGANRFFPNLAKLIFVPAMTSCFFDSYAAEFGAKLCVNGLNSVLFSKGAGFGKLKFFTTLTALDGAECFIKYLLSDGAQNNQVSEQVAIEPIISELDNFILHSNSME